MNNFNSVTFCDGFQNPNPTPFIGEVTVTPAAEACEGDSCDDQTTGTTHTHKVRLKTGEFDVMGGW